MTHEEAVKAWEQSKAEHVAAIKVEADAARREIEAEVEVYRIEGRTHTPRAQWCLAWLESRHADCDRFLNLLYPRQAEVKRPATADEVAALQAEAEAMEAAP